MKKVFAFLMVLIMVGLAVAACGPAAKYECADALGCIDIGPSEPIHIAYAMVVSGENSTLGLDTKYGVELAIDDKGGKLLGHDIKFDGQDTLCNAEGGTTAATKIAADKTIAGVIGTNCSSEAVPGAPIISDAGLSMISPSNTAPYLTDPAKRAPGYFRTAHNDKVQGAAAAQFVWEYLKLTKVAAIHDGGPYTEALANVFADNFKKLGGTVTAVEAVNVGDKDMGPVLTRLAAGGPELVYFPVFVAEGGYIAAQFKDTPGLENTAMMGADGIFTPDFLKAGGPNTVGMYWSSPDFSAFGTGYETMVANYLKKYNVAGTLAPFHAHAYDAANMIFAAIEKVAVQDADGTLHIPKQALRDAIAATKDFKGITGNLTCDPYGDCADPRIAVYQLQQSDFDAGTMPKTPIWKQTK